MRLQLLIGVSNVRHTANVQRELSIGNSPSGKPRRGAAAFQSSHGSEQNNNSELTEAGESPSAGPGPRPWGRPRPGASPQWGQGRNPRRTNKMERAGSKA